jgi:3-oxoacyl-[acyl-carrier protein] reductase
VDLDLKGRVAVVTGASAGIGRVTAAMLAAEGCHVVAVARRAAYLESLDDQIESAGGSRPVTVVVDLTDRDAAGRVAAEVRETFGRVDVLANIAGGSELVPTLDDDYWLSQFELNFHSKRRLTESLLPMLQASGRGRVVNFVGILEPLRISPALAAVAACIVWSKALSRTVAADGVTVNCIAPGRIESEQIAKVYADKRAREEFIAARIPAGRFGQPEEAASLVVFLASGPASYLTGEMLAVDGGMHWSI